MRSFRYDNSPRRMTLTLISFVGLNLTLTINLTASNTCDPKVLFVIAIFASRPTSELRPLLPYTAPSLTASYSEVQHVIDPHGDELRNANSLRTCTNSHSS